MILICTYIDMHMILIYIYMHDTVYFYIISTNDFFFNVYLNYLYTYHFFNIPHMISCFCHPGFPVVFVLALALVTTLSVPSRRAHGT